MDVDQSLDLSESNIVDRAVVHISTIFMLLIIVLATHQTVARNVRTYFGFDFVVHWTEPAARHLFIIATFWGVAVASRNSEHITIDLIPRMIEDRWPQAYAAQRSIVTVFNIVFLAFAFVGMAYWTVNNWDTHIGGLGFLPGGGVIYLTITIGIAIAILYEIINLYRYSGIGTKVEEKWSIAAKYGSTERSE